MDSNDKVLKQIERLKQKMTKVVQQEGFTSEEALKISQQIDCLLNKYNRRN